MPNLSFDILNSKDFYNKLIDDYNDFNSDTTSSRLAINCAMTAWHLGEWLYSEYKPQLQATFNTWDHYRDYLKSNECVQLEIMQRITNGSKHFLTARRNEKVQGTEKHIGAFSGDFSSDFDQTALLVEMDDGTKVWFEDELDVVIAFWTNYIPTTFGLTL